MNTSDRKGKNILAKFRFKKQVNDLESHKHKQVQAYDVNLFGDDGKRRGPKWVIPVAALAMLVTGTTNMILTQILFMTRIPHQNGDDDSDQYFRGPLLVQMGNSVGQALCLIIYVCDQWLARRRKRSRGFLDLAPSPECSITTITGDDTPNRLGKDRLGGLEEESGSVEKKDASPTRWIFSAVCDFTASVLLILALQVSQAYTVQVYRNLAVIMCALLSISFLKRDLRVFHWLGILVITIGLMATGLGGWLVSKRDASGAFAGPALTLLSCLVQVFQLIYEERIMHKYKMESPYRGIGWTGTWEILITSIALVVSHFAGIENLGRDWYQLMVSARVRISLISFAASVGIFMSSGLMITKLGAAILTSVVASTRQVPIWIVEVSAGWVNFNWLSFTGLWLCCVGHLIYNNTFSSRLCCGCYHRRAMKEVRLRCYCRRDEDETVVDSDDSNASLISSGQLSSTQSAAETDKDQDGDVEELQIADNVVRAAVVTTRHLGYGGLSNDTAWIYVRRQSEPIDPPQRTVSDVQDAEAEAKQFLAGILDRALTPDDQVVIKP